MDHRQAANEDNWYAMAFRYETAHAQEWRAHAKRDLDVCMTGLISYALQNSTHVLLCGHATATVYYQTKPTPRPRWLAQILARGTIYPEHVASTGICEDLVGHLPYFTRGSFGSAAGVELYPKPSKRQNSRLLKHSAPRLDEARAKNQKERYMASPNCAF